MKKIVTLVLASLAGTALAQGAPGAGVSLTLSMQDKRELELRYDVAPTCQRLSFANFGIRPAAASAMRGDWKSIDDCAQPDSTGMSIRQGCSSVRLRIPSVVRDLDRVFPWAHPLESGIYAHTSAYAVLPTCGPVRWKFAAPGGEVVVDGKPSGRVAERTPETTSIDHMPVIFLAREPLPGPESYLNIDSRFSKTASVFLRQTMSDLNREYAHSFPKLPFPRPFVVAVPTAPGQRTRGDVANRSTVRLTMEASPSEHELGLRRQYIAHEVAHLLQPLKLDDVWNDELTLINEGGAEFLSWMASARLGWMTRTELASKADNALNSCLLKAGNNPWQNNANRHWGANPYNCGLAFHLIGLASAGGKGVSQRMLGQYYLSGENGKRTDFADALECGGARACQARWLPRLMGAHETVADVVASFSEQFAFLTPATEWTPELANSAAQSLLAQLMEVDCKGQISIYSGNGSARIGQVQSCASLREGMVITGAEGLAFFARRDAIAAVVDACGRTGKTSVDVEKRGSLVLDCAPGLLKLPVLYKFNVTMLLQRL